MKISLNRLNEKVNNDLDAAALAEALTMAGLEVGAVTPAAPEFSKVVIAEIIATHTHPNAEKLTCCDVKMNDAEIVPIVCGDPRVAAGMKVALAQVGAKLPNGMKIKKSKLRGEPSHGMLCSKVELGIAETSEGILVLPADAPVGEAIRDWMLLDDEVLDVELTPNRGDCLSMLGVAREVSAITEATLKPVKTKEVKGEVKATLEVKLEAPEACPRYLGRVIEDVNNQTPTPIWMQESLRRADIRCVSLVVDVLNYVMIELGQPMHAFDLTKLHGAISVRFARAGEALTLLNEEDVKLREDTLVIADEKAPVALAGIMGGFHTGVQPTTTTLFLESAFFSPTIIAGKARKYGVSSDASHRFERGVDFNLPRQAIEMATDLIVSIAGGKPGSVTEAMHEKHLPQRPAIKLLPERVSRVLGVGIQDQTIEAILKRLGMDIEKKDEHYWVTPPSYRFDIAIVEDLIEEVARIYGYHNIPVTDFSAKLNIVQPSSRVLSETKVKALLRDRGYAEAITYSFVAPEWQLQVDPTKTPIPLLNPISAEMSVMRTTLWVGLLSAVKYNLNRQQSRLRLFELGRRFLQTDKEVKQTLMLSGVVVGAVAPEQWSGSSDKVDFYDMKSDVEAILAAANITGAIEFVPAEHAALHPGQTASIVLNQQVVGLLGRIHPRVQKKLRLKAPVFMYELDFEAINAMPPMTYQAISMFPAVRRDFAFIVDQAVLTGDVMKATRQIMGDWLTDSVIFDVFEGGDLEKNQKSVAMGLTLQHPSRTLEDEEVNELCTKLMKGLGDTFNAALRE